MAIKLYNVLTKRHEEFAPVTAGEVRIYLCGVTVYGRCHVGHLRCYLSFDAILRYFAYRGFKVRYVRNFTDIDDKIIMRANEISAGPSGAWRGGPAYAEYDECQWRERLEEDQLIAQRAAGQSRHLAEVVADHFIDVFQEEDFGPFELFAAEAEPRVSQSIPEVLALIQQIIDRGFAYVVGGDVYFDVPAYHDKTLRYGVLSGRNYTQLIDGARVAPTDKKRSAPDFALWKAAHEGEPAWDSPWGKGRPGWHIECSAMSSKAFEGRTFDIHGGGKDLIFPHHENEIAQSEAATEQKYCNAWMHNGFVTVDGVKMSKSLGNFISIKEALGLAPPEVWRLLVQSAHYASPIDFSRSKQGTDGCRAARGTIDVAFERLEYFYETLQRADAALAGQEISSEEPTAGEARADVRARFIEAMDDDFNTAVALAHISDAMRFVNELCDLKAKDIKKLKNGRATWLATLSKVTGELREVLGVLCLCGRSPQDALGELRNFTIRCLCVDRQCIEAKINEREEARAAKDFGRSDALRDELKALHVEVRDTPGGPVWKVVR